MADENKPAFYPRVGNIKAKNFKPAQPMPFVDDERAMDLPQYGDVDLSVPSKENLEMARRMAERDAQLRRQREADRSPLEKLAGGLQAGRFLGSAMTQGINSIPTRIFKGDEAADKFMEERIYKPEQPVAYEYAQDVGDFLEKLETEYKIPPLMPEALPLQHLSSPATSQAMRTAGKGAEQVGRKLESAMEPVVKGAFERGGLPREMVMAMGANTQSNVIKPYGGNWLGGGDKEQIRTPESDLRRLKVDTMIGREGDTVESLNTQKDAINKWIDSNLKNYVKKEMGTRDDPIRKLAEEGIIHTPLRNDLDRMEYLQAIRKAEGYPAEGMGKSDLAKQWENLSDDSIRVTKAGKIQEAATVNERLDEVRAEIADYQKQIDDDFINLLKGKGGLDIKDREVFDKMPTFQKAEILGDTKLKDLHHKSYELMARIHGFEKRAGEINPFVAKLDPETKLYSGGTYDLGFDHVVDVLREDLATGRIRPEQLNKVSMEQAVRRTYEYDQEMAKKMAETQAKVTEGMPVVKEYPEGYKWIELATPKLDSLPEGSSFQNLPTGMIQVVDSSGTPLTVPARDEAHALRLLAKERGYKNLEDALKYEGDKMGHCVGGYCPDVSAGKSQIYSLRDAKGEPHVTIEVEPHNPNLEAIYARQNLPDLYAKYTSNRNDYDNSWPEFLRKEAPDLLTATQNKIVQIKGKGNAKPKDNYLPFVQDFVRGGNWSTVGDLKNTNMMDMSTYRNLSNWLKERGIEHPRYVTKEEFGKYEGDYLLDELKPPPPAGMKRGGKVSISNNPDTMMLEVNNQKMKNGVPAYSGAGLIKGGLKAARPAISDAERALPLRLTRAMPKSNAEINAHAERVARQMMGEHVTSGKAGDTKNLAGRSMKESQRVKALEYELEPTKVVPESQVYQPRIGDINVALGGDFTVSDVMLKRLMGEEVNSKQEGGSRYGLGHMKAKTPLFYASNEVPAQAVQNKVTDLYDLFGPERVMGHHMAMGPIATNFAQHFADANLRYTDYSKLTPENMMMFDQLMAKGYEITKKNPKTGEVTTKVVDFPKWPGIANPQAAYEAMRKNSEMRKFYNKVMQTPSITEPLGLPNGLDVRYAITSPDLRDMEVNLTGHGVGELVPYGELTDTARHKTYSKGIPGMYEGHQEVLTPFAISFPDAAQHIISTQRPQDFTGTIQKVFPHQRVDQQFIDEMEQYRRRIKELTGKKKGGAVEKAEGGYIKKPAAYINGDEFVNAAKKYGIKDSMNNLNKIVDLVNKGLSVDDAARQVADTGMHKAAGGAITGDDLIIEERPL